MDHHKILENPLLKSKKELLTTQSFTSRQRIGALGFSSLAPQSTSLTQKLSTTKLSASLFNKDLSGISFTVKATKKDLINHDKVKKARTAKPLLFSSLQQLGHVGTTRNDSLQAPTVAAVKLSTASAKPLLFSSVPLKQLSLTHNDSPRGTEIKFKYSSTMPTEVKQSRKKKHSVEKSHKSDYHSRSKKKYVGKKHTEEADINALNYDLSLGDTRKKKELESLQEMFKTNAKNLFIEKADNSELAKAEVEKINRKKFSLINLVSIALLRSPNIDDVNDPTRLAMIEQLKNIANDDPEFILKLALYTRQHLNIRVIANFLLAFAAYLTEARPYIKKYFSKAIVLPSDWIAVAELYQTFFDKTINFGSLPTALRKAMISKFLDFDEFQLAKYNKEKTKKKTVVVRKSSVPSNADDINSDMESDDENEETIELRSLTLKQLIRKLHISEPVHNVMCLIGKKYPSDLETFYQSRLPGTFEEEKAGKRMKLQTPETWETQVSLKGNKSSTWQDLIDHNKLPFMAMLRNLRNMVQAGLSTKYHSKILKRLTDERSVINSRQFPFRFLSAYEVLDDLENMLDMSLRGEVIVPRGRGGARGGRGRGRGRGRGGGRGADSSTPIPLNTYNKEILQRYKKALDTALKISTIHNIPPISGTTVIIIQLEQSIANTILQSAKSFTQKREVVEMCLLLGLMCNYHCEDAIFILHDQERNRYTVVESLDDDSILDNVAVLVKRFQDLFDKSIGSDEINQLLIKYLAQRKQINNFLVVGGGISDEFLSTYMQMYRKDVNPACLAVFVDVIAMGKPLLQGDYDVRICGFSDQVLRYVAERGNGGQLTFVENIDIAHNLTEITVTKSTLKSVPYIETIEKIERPVMPWKTIRVFISSTFKDMHGERDLLTRHVFPELRCWCYNYCLNVYEVDLRWGITNKQAESEKQLEICLNEVMKSDLFVGIVGSRYGWKPECYDVSGDLEWLKDMKPGLSITELEMKSFIRKHKSNATSRAFFYFRDPSLLENVPKGYKRDFASENTDSANCLLTMKEWLKRSGMEIYNNYPSRWGGVIDGKPVAVGLEEFGERVLNNLWNGIKKNFIASSSEETSQGDIPTTTQHPEFAGELSKKFVGRKTLITNALKTLDDVKNKSDKNLILITGRSGAGKTAFMGKLITLFNEQRELDSLCYFVELATNSCSVKMLLQYVCEKLNGLFNIGMSIQETYRELKQNFEVLSKAVSKKLHGEQFVIFIDGLDQIHSENISLTDWIPDQLPKGVVLVISCVDNTLCQKQITNHKQFVDNIKIGAMELADRANFVRQILTQYGKVLDESPFNNQMKLLLSKKDSNSPLYLKLACEELRLFGVYEKLNEHLKKLSQTVPQLVHFTLKRIEMENSQQITTNALALLYCSRKGLTEDELYDMLNMLHNFESLSLLDASEIGSQCYFSTTLAQQQIPRAYFIKMFRSIKIFLSEGTETGVFRLLFNDIISIVEKQYIQPGGTDYIAKVHIVLAGFYRKQADPSNDKKWNGHDRKALDELPYHLTACGVQWQDLKVLLCSITFIKAKVEMGMCLQLLEDFQMNAGLKSRQQQKDRDHLQNNADVAGMKDFIATNIHILSKYPNLLLQQAVNTTCNFSVTEAFTKEELGNVIHCLNKSEKKSACSLTISSIQKAVLCINLSKDESTIACGLADGQVILYDISTTKELKSFIGHANAITACSFAGMTKLCSASEDGMISVWDVQAGHRLHQLKHKRQVSCCHAINDGRILISTSWDNTAKLWSLSDGKLAGQLTGYSHPFNCIAMDKMEKHAALGSWDRKIVIWNVLDNTKTAVYKGHKSSIRALTYSPSGTHLASASLAGEIFLWSTTNGTKVGEMSHCSFPIKHLTYSPSGMELIAASSDTSIKIWSGNLGCPERESISDNTDYALCVAVEITNGHTCVGYNSGKIVLYDQHLKKMKEWKAHSSSIRSMSIIYDTNDNTQLVTASDDCLIKRWVILHGNTLVDNFKCISVMEGHTSSVKCVRSKQAFILSASEDGTLRLWPGILFGEDNSQPIQAEALAVFRGHTGVVTCCDVSNCETMAVSGATDRTLIIWDLVNKVLLCNIFSAHSDGLTTCCWSDVGNYVITGSNDFMLKLWDTKYLIANKDSSEKLKEKVKFIGHTSAINDVKYKFGCVASVSADGALKVWTHKGVIITTLNQHESRVNSCEIWAPVSLQDANDEWSTNTDEKSVQQKVREYKPKSLFDVLVFTASDDGIVKSCRPFKQHLLSELYGHSNIVTDITTCKQSEQIISSSTDQSIKIWNLKTSATDLKHHSGEVSATAIYDENLSASGGRDGIVHIYQENRRRESINISGKNAVTVVSFLSEQILVTGDNGGILTMLSTRPFYIVDQFNVKSPIQAMDIGGAVKNTIVVSTYMNMCVFKWDGNKLMEIYDTPLHPVVVVGKSEPLLKEIVPYPMTNMSFIPNKDALVISSITYGSFFRDLVHHTFTSIPIKNTSPVEVMRISDGFNIYFGHSDGTVSIALNARKLHDGPVTGLLIFNDNTLITASKDCTIKVWEFEGQEFQPKQVGLYYCRAPINSLSGYMTSEYISLMAGDVIGNVEFLKINL